MEHLVHYKTNNQINCMGEMINKKRENKQVSHKIEVNIYKKTEYLLAWKVKP